ncbi:MAG: amidohydrolase family protein, partial [Steroidobacteraceae bacterium]
ELATIGGAKALMMDDRIGSLEAGKDADVLVIDRRGETQLSPPAALIPNLVYGNGPSPDAVHRVMVAGKTIVKDGEHVRIDRRAAVTRSDALQDRLLDEVDARGFVRKRTRFTWH